MTNQEIAAERFAAYDREMINFTMNVWVNMTDLVARSKAEQDIKNKHGVHHGWIVVNGEGFNHEKAFPTRSFPRFPADQGLSD